MAESTTSQLNQQALNESSAQITERWRLDGIIEKLKEIVAQMSGQRMDMPESTERTHESRYSNCDDQSITAHPNAHVQYNRFDLSERTLSVLAIVLSMAALVTSFWSIHESDRAERETKQLQIQVMDQNALMIREGFRQPTDLTYGPAGNLEYKPREPKPKE